MHQNTRQIQVPSTMKASVYREFGGPEVLRYEDIPTPKPAEGEALVKVLAVAIDYIQLHIRHGGSGRIGSSDEAHYGIKDPPHIPGGMACVEVMGLGPNSEGVEIGTRHLVGGLRPGSTVEYGVIDTESLQPRPDGRPSPTAYPASFTPEQAAAFDYAPVAYHTLKIAARLTVREKLILIHAAAGGTGVLAVQLAKHIGARRLSQQRAAKQNFNSSESLVRMRRLTIERMISCRRC